MKRKLFVWIICTMMLMLSVPVMADEASVDQLDYSRTGSISVDIHTSDTAQKPVPGATLAIYQVAKVVDNEFRYTEDFKNCPSKYLSEIGAKDQGDHQNSKELAGYILNNNIQPADVQEVQLNSQGKAVAVFGNLELGLYLIMQKSPAVRSSNIEPFSVTVPRKVGTKYIYDVEANPKPGAVTTVTPVPTTTPKPTATPVPTLTPAPTTLPQTGQLWWPVPLLIAAGAALLISGLLAERRKAAA